jgi:hypothetical protein
LQAIREGNLHFLNTAVLRYLVQQGASGGTFLIAEEFLDHVNRKLARKVEHRVVKEIGDELFHRDLPVAGMEKAKHC